MASKKQQFDTWKLGKTSSLTAKEKALRDHVEAFAIQMKNDNNVDDYELNVRYDGYNVYEVEAGFPMVNGTEISLTGSFDKNDQMWFQVTVTKFYPTEVVVYPLAKTINAALPNLSNVVDLPRPGSAAADDEEGGLTTLRGRAARRAGGRGRGRGGRRRR